MDCIYMAPYYSKRTQSLLQMNVSDITHLNTGDRGHYLTRQQLCVQQRVGEGSLTKFMLRLWLKRIANHTTVEEHMRTSCTICLLIVMLICKHYRLGYFVAFHRQILLMRNTPSSAGNEQ